MDIVFKGTNLELTDALKTYAQEKISGLEKYYPDVLRARVELERTTRHHHKGGDLWRAEANLQAPKHLFRAEAEAQDIYAAVDALKDELKHELRRWKEKNSGTNVRKSRNSRGGH